MLALATLAIADLGWEAEDRFPLVVFLASVPYMLALAIRSALRRRALRMAALLDLVLGWCPPLLQALAVLFGGWLTRVEYWLGQPVSVDAWPGLPVVFGLLPFGAYSWTAIDARARALADQGEDARPLRSFGVRMLLATSLPFGLYFLCAQSIGWNAVWRVHVEEVTLFATLFTGSLVVLLLVFLPTLLRHTWETSALPAGPLRQNLEEVAQRMGFRCRELLLWRTGFQMSNAAIVGFFPTGRLVLFTDALLERLRPRELAAVFAHEVGHAKRHHAASFGLFVLTFFLASDLAIRYSGLRSESAQLAMFGGMLVLFFFGFGYVSRRFELEADLESLEALGDPAPIVTALLAVTRAQARRKNSWRHFSVEHRVQFLLAVAVDPERGRRMRRKLRRLTAALAVSCLGLLGWQGVLLAEGLATERVLADLRLGRYGAAHERIQSGAEVPEPLTALLDRALALDPEDRTPEAFEDRAWRAHQRGEIGQALQWLDLALLRGTERLEALQEEWRTQLDRP